jgi:hypothetical protein
MRANKRLTPATSFVTADNSRAKPSRSPCLEASVDVNSYASVKNNKASKTTKHQKRQSIKDDKALKTTKY